jgi:hypothetical protein
MAILDTRKGITMRQLLGFALLVFLPLAGSAADDKVEAKGKELGFEPHSGYFESNKSGLKGDASYLTFTDQAAFDKIFGKAVVMGSKAKFLPKDAFDSKMALAVIKRGKEVWTYDVEKVTADEGTIYVQYKATSKDGGGAMFASPMVVSIDKGKYTSVVFLENGKKVETIKLDKEKDKEE